jgi:hypothetical protein
MAKGGKKQVGAGAQAKGAGTGANTDVAKAKSVTTWCFPIEINPSIRINVAWIAEIFRANSCGIMRQIGSTTMPRNSSIRTREIRIARHVVGTRWR